MALRIVLAAAVESPTSSGDVAGDLLAGPGEVGAAHGPDQPDIVQQRGREEHFTVHVQVFQRAQRGRERERAVGVVEQRGGEPPTCLGLGGAGQGGVRGPQAIGGHPCPPAGVDADEHGQPADGVGHVRARQWPEQAATLGAGEQPAGALHPGVRSEVVRRSGHGRSCQAGLRAGSARTRQPTLTVPRGGRPGTEPGSVSAGVLRAERSVAGAGVPAVPRGGWLRGTASGGGVGQLRTTTGTASRTPPRVDSRLMVPLAGGWGPLRSRRLQAPSASTEAWPRSGPVRSLPRWIFTVLLVVTVAVPSTRHSLLSVRNSTRVVVSTSAIGLICTVATSLPPGPVTVSWKISGAEVFGMVKVGLTAV